MPSIGNPFVKGGLYVSYGGISPGRGLPEAAVTLRAAGPFMDVEYDQETAAKWCTWRPPTCNTLARVDCRTTIRPTHSDEEGAGGPGGAMSTVVVPRGRAHYILSEGQNDAGQKPNER